MKEEKKRGEGKMAKRRRRWRWRGTPEGWGGSLVKGASWNWRRKRRRENGASVVRNDGNEVRRS